MPNRASQYANAGEALPAVQSRQWEAGFKGGADAFGWQVAYFDIARPVTNLDACNRLGIRPALAPTTARRCIAASRPARSGRRAPGGWPAA